MEDIFSKTNHSTDDTPRKTPTPVNHPSDNDRIKTYEIDLSKYRISAEETGTENIDYDDYYNSGAYQKQYKQQLRQEASSDSVPEAEAETGDSFEDIYSHSDEVYDDYTAPSPDNQEYESVEYEDEYYDEYQMPEEEFKSYENNIYDDEILPALEDEDDYEVKRGIFNNHRFMTCLIVLLAALLIVFLALLITQFGGVWNLRRGEQNTTTTESVSLSTSNYSGNIKTSTTRNVNSDTSSSSSSKTSSTSSTSSDDSSSSSSKSSSRSSTKSSNSSSSSSSSENTQETTTKTTTKTTTRNRRTITSSSDLEN